jgi:hypothetical protein
VKQIPDTPLVPQCVSRGDVRAIGQKFGIAFAALAPSGCNAFLNA